MKKMKRYYTPHWRPQTNNLRNRRKRRVRKTLCILLLSILVILILVGSMLFMPIGKKRAKGYAYITKSTTTEEVAAQLEEEVSLSSKWIFSRYAQLIGLQKHLRPGRYAVRGGMSYYRLLKKLAYEGQDPVTIVFSSVRTQEQLVEKLTAPLALSAEELQSLLSDPAFCASKGFDTNTIRCIFLPNSFQVYWNISAKDLVEKFYNYYQSFWNDQRKKLAQSENLTPIEISIIASIVEEESNKTNEYSRIAGLYINRLQKGMLLQADPTVKYAVGDFTIKRITSKHTTIDSPYNTYKVKGLPPGPIRFPQEKTLDAVLHYEKHPYLYMCAKSDLSGYHDFATSYTQHLANAYRYQAKLDTIGIKSDNKQ